MAESKNRFNLLDEPWVPLAGAGLISLRDAFRPGSDGDLGGNALEKIALYKLLLAIAQAACTPEDDQAWMELGPEGLSSACLDYLDKWREAFWLYGERPFLQMPQVQKAGTRPLGALQPHVATGNTTVLLDLQQEKPLPDAERALLLVTVSGGGLGGKKTDNRLVLSPGYRGKQNDKGKAATGRPGPWLGFMGYLHHFLLGETLPQSLWLNLFTRENIRELIQPLLSTGLGQAPWEAMPQGEACSSAENLKNSLLGRLVPLAKFCLLEGEAMHYTDGVAYPSHKEGGFDPSIALYRSGKDIKALWADPARDPWRELPALLSFLGGEPGTSCAGLRACLIRAAEAVPEFGLWAGGLRVSSNAGEQYVSGDNDFVDSSLRLPSACLRGSVWYTAFKREMEALVRLGKILYGSTRAYGEEMKADAGKMAEKATRMFWELCGREAQRIIEVCHSEAMPELRGKLAGFARDAYNSVCPGDTARQLEAWAAHLPRPEKYLTQP